MIDDFSDNNTKPWWIYLIRNRLGHLYCGISPDVIQRFYDHCNNKGSKYLKGKQPLQLEWCQPLENRRAAAQLEVKIKKLPKYKKENIVLQQNIYGIISLNK